jgi:hypothetical protein
VQANNVQNNALPAEARLSLTGDQVSLEWRRTKRSGPKLAVTMETAFVITIRLALTVAREVTAAVGILHSFVPLCHGEFSNEKPFQNASLE